VLYLTGRCLTFRLFDLQFLKLLRHHIVTAAQAGWDLLAVLVTSIRYAAGLRLWNAAALLLDRFLVDKLVHR
jgi:hypothetical protein